MSVQEITISKSKKHSFGTLSLRSDGILTFEPTDGISTLSLDDLKTMLATFKEFSCNTPLPFFSNNRNMRSLGAEEKEFVGKNIHLFASKSAITENSPIVRFIMYMIIYFYTPPIPMKMFKTEEEAIKWLKQND